MSARVGGSATAFSRRGTEPPRGRKLPQGHVQLQSQASVCLRGSDIPPSSRGLVSSPALRPPHGQALQLGTSPCPSWCLSFLLCKVKRQNRTAGFPQGGGGCAAFTGMNSHGHLGCRIDLRPHPWGPCQDPSPAALRALVLGHYLHLLLVLKRGACWAGWKAA